VAADRGPNASQIVTVPVAVFGVTVARNIPVSPRFAGVGPTVRLVVVAAPGFPPIVTVAGDSFVESPAITLM
jgi:hypothetical protein